MEKIRMLNESNEYFIEYLLSDFTKAKNKTETYVDTANIYYSNLNMRESMYNFIHSQQGKTKKLMDFEVEVSDDFEFYLNEAVAGITDNKFDMCMHYISNFLFYLFNN